MKKNKLNWKIKRCDDLSAEWLEATVKPLQWTYVVDDHPEDQCYTCSLFLSETTCEEVRISTKPLKSIEKSKAFCEAHLEKTYKQFKKLFE